MWTVNPGREDDFVAILTGLEGSMEGTLAPPTLLRDREHPNLFITMTQWESAEAIDRFRAGTMREAIEQNSDVLESFQPRTLDEVGIGD